MSNKVCLIFNYVHHNAQMKHIEVILAFMKRQHLALLKAALPPSNVRLSDPKHVDGGLVELDEHAVEDLAQTEQLQNFADLGADTVDTERHLK